MQVIGEETQDDARSALLESDRNSQSEIKGSYGSQKSINSNEESPIGHNGMLEDSLDRMHEQEDFRIRRGDSPSPSNK